MDILVVEDDAEVSQFLALGLRDAGHAVDLANNGADGLSIAQKKRFDLMILDRMLPGNADGAELLTTLRKNGIDTPALFVSGLGELSDWAIGLQAGGDDYLVKPFSMAEILQHIEVLTMKTEDQNPTAPALITE